MKSSKFSLILIMLSLGLVMADFTFAQSSQDQSMQNGSQQRTQSRDQVRDPAANGGQQKKQQQNRYQKGKDQ
ncbi:MAG: hypothetical protein GQ538_10475, partial [Xanthomonadales bacterium]|nr:hypothetical protein [Xanthomonadales bacterium]